MEKKIVYKRNAFSCMSCAYNMQTFAIYLCFGCSLSLSLATHIQLRLFVYLVCVHTISPHIQTDCNISAVRSDDCNTYSLILISMCMLCAEFTCELLSHITRISVSKCTMSFPPSTTITWTILPSLFCQMQRTLLHRIVQRSGRNE